MCFIFKNISPKINSSSKNFPNNCKFTSNLTFGPTFQIHFNFSPLELIFWEIFCWGEIWAIIHKERWQTLQIFFLLCCSKSIPCSAMLAGKFSAGSRHWSGTCWPSTWGCGLPGVFSAAGPLPNQGTCARTSRASTSFYRPAAKNNGDRSLPLSWSSLGQTGFTLVAQPGRRLFRRPSAARRPCCWWPWSLAATPGTRRCGAALVATIRESDKKKILIFFNVYNSSIFSPDLSASGDTPGSLLGRSRGPERRVEAGLLTAVSRPVTFLPDWSKEANLVPPSQKKIFHF